MTKSVIEVALQGLPFQLDSIQVVPCSLTEPFIEVAQRFAHLPGTVALVSGGTLDCARYNILGIWPWLTCRGGLSQVTLEHSGGVTSVAGDSLSVLQGLLRRFAFRKSHALPLSSGFLGYLSYDLKDALTCLPRTSIDDLWLSHLYLVAPSLLLIEDRLERQANIVLPSVNGSGEDAAQRLSNFERKLREPKPTIEKQRTKGTAINAGFTRESYKAAIEAIREYIARGDVYQVNLSQRFELPFSGNAFELFADLFARNPAPFFAYVNASDHQIISTSPERFLRLEGNVVETRPIKGTRPRGTTAEQDARLRQELLSSSKDEAELCMIVDLMRNDLGRVCQIGSVHVADHKRLEAYENVYHLVSTVRGTLDADNDAVDLIRATFPGGSITGCPKIRAMQIIDELEPVRRHVYTGSIGYIGFDGTMDLSIAIRTATIADGRLVFSVGGGVVYDSNAEDEYEETLHKGRTLFDAVNATLAKSPVERIGYCNGRYKPVSEIAISVDTDGFAYGYGIFETIRVDRGCPRRLEEHLARFENSFRHCFQASPPDITWRDVIAQVISRNSLSEETAAVKLLASAGKGERKHFDGTLLVTARSYRHRLAGTGRTGLHLVTYPHPRHSPLAAHKTMNYAVYKMAGKWARENHADEALILDVDLAVSESNTGNVFASIDGKLYRTLSENALCGTMEQAVLRQLRAWGMPVERRRLTVTELARADFIFITNALMGAVPVTQFEGTPMSVASELCGNLNEALLGVRVP